MTKKARQTFAKQGKDGLAVVVNEDDLYADDHPYVKAWPDMFGDFEELGFVHQAPKRAPKPAEPVVEQATAAGRAAPRTGKATEDG
jgi:hypothetical protein